MTSILYVSFILKLVLDRFSEQERIKQLNHIFNHNILNAINQNDFSEKEMQNCVNYIPEKQTLDQLSLFDCTVKVKDNKLQRRNYQNLSIFPSILSENKQLLDNKDVQIDYLSTSEFEAGIFFSLFSSFKSVHKKKTKKNISIRHCFFYLQKSDLNVKPF